MTKHVECQDENGFIWITALPDYIKDCTKGVILGPPEGFSVGLHNALAKAGFISAPDLLGKRKELLSIAKLYGFDIRTLIHIYQVQYYGV